MKRFPKYLLISLITFFIGLFVVSIWCLSKTGSPQPVKTETIISVETTLAENTTEEVKDEDEFRAALEDIWIEDKEVNYNGYKITKKCLGNEDLEANCRTEISKNNRILSKFESMRDNWLQYGFFNLLGKSNKQLIITSVRDKN